LDNEFKKALLINPPGPLYQRGEDRCQANIDASSAVSLRAPNDLAYSAAMLRRINVEPIIRDYPAENISWQDFENDVKRICPDVLVVSVTHATILQDLEAFRIAKRIDPAIITVAKGALFFAAPMTLFQKPEFDVMDFALIGESETVIHHLIGGLRKRSALSSIGGILYKSTEGQWVRNESDDFEMDLDALPFPARDLLRNDLYVRPDTGEPQATIQTARGCPSHCIFCLTPAISGSRVRSRSAKNIVDEIEECVTRYHIRNFFFKADTFTINKNFVIELCREIIDRKLDIAWVANSRVDTVDEERLQWMKKAGCWLVAFGFESGSDDLLKKMKKDARVSDAYTAVSLVRQAGMQIYGFFMIGLPWDNKETVQETLALAKNLDCDFSEIHLATPYEGTELHTIAKELGLIDNEVIGHDYFSDPIMGTMFLSREEILDYRRNGLRGLYFSPKYIMKTLSKVRSPQELVHYASYGMRLARNILVPH
jgi:anaerobic magnesium-protoporphyrin IX monomethyl ester cyclase